MSTKENDIIEEQQKEDIINNLTPEQEEILCERHAETYTGTDDDMPDGFENWLQGASADYLKKVLKLEEA